MRSTAAASVSPSRLPTPAVYRSVISCMAAAVQQMEISGPAGAALLHGAGQDQAPRDDADAGVSGRCAGSGGGADSTAAVLNNRAL